MTNVSDFVSYIRPDVSGCPDVLIKREVVQAAIKLCSEAFLWREETYPQALVKNVRDYHIYLPNDDADPVQLESLTINGDDINPIDIETLNQRSPDWRTTEGMPTRYYHRNSHVEISFNKIPTKTYATGIRALYAMKPKRTATTLPDFLYADWLEDIQSGALSRLLVMPNKEWSNGELGLYHKEQFMNSIAKARIQMNNQWSDGPLRAKGRKVVSNKINF